MEGRYSPPPGCGDGEQEFSCTFMAYKSPDIEKLSRSGFPSKTARPRANGRDWTEHVHTFAWYSALDQIVHAKDTVAKNEIGQKKIVNLLLAQHDWASLCRVIE
jgi:hypothetical protein